jgi:hypothetical protein
MAIPGLFTIDLGLFLNAIQLMALFTLCGGFCQIKSIEGFFVWGEILKVDLLK